MNTGLFAFGIIHLQGESVTHPLMRLFLSRRRFVAVIHPDASSDASNYGL